MPPYTLETERLLLKTLDERYALQVSAYLRSNKEFHAPWGPKVPNEYFTDAYQKHRLAREYRGLHAGSSFRFYLYLKQQPEQIIGDVHISNVVRGVFQSANLGYKIAEQHRGKGYMVEALQAITQFAFKEQQLHRLEANIIPENEASIRAVEKAGFVREGLAKEYLFINGTWRDHYHYVILNKQWQASKP